ncbi:MAG TPA: Smr/MutS family protein [Methylomirabilota bacterium]|nr:Smr/MutS family protein [Methylomirabilota bacterium]
MNSDKQSHKGAPFESEREASDAESPFPEPVSLPLEDVLDLHPFSPKEIRSVVEEYLTQCYTAGFPTVRLIHGKGIGVQRERIRALLARLPYVRSFYDAPPEAGGWGATIVELRPFSCLFQESKDK